MAELAEEPMAELTEEPMAVSGAFIRWMLSTASEFMDQKEMHKPVSLLDEFYAFYSGVDGDISSRLCDTCKALQIDDSSFGGSIRSCESTDDCQHLFFQDLPSYMSQDGSAKFMSLPMQFERRDSLPGLPSLAESAESGCQFCALLISTLQNRGLTKIPSIESIVSITNAQYEWHTKEDNDAKEEKKKHRDFLPGHSLHLFSLRVQVDNDEPFKLWFRISAPPSKSSWPCGIWYSDN